MGKTARKAKTRKQARGASGKGAPAKAPDDRIFQLKVVLMDIRPPIWRTFLVPSKTALSELHEILQTVMGWEDYHLHCFRIGADEYGPPDPENFNRDARDEAGAVLAEIAPEKGAVFFYDYDFGDGWEHRVSVEDIVPAAKGIDGRVANCIDGARACPLEDCGGVPGYEEMLRVLGGKADPDHDREELLEWAGDFEPEKFNINTVNKLLRELFGRNL